MLRVAVSNHILSHLGEVSVLRHAPQEDEL